MKCFHHCRKEQHNGRSLEDFLEKPQQICGKLLGKRQRMVISNIDFSMIFFFSLLLFTSIPFLNLLQGHCELGTSTRGIRAKGRRKTLDGYQLIEPSLYIFNVEMFHFRGTVA